MSLTHYLLDIIFPPVCLACKNYLGNSGEKSRHLCGICSGKLDFLPGFLCPVCFRRFPVGENPPVGGCHKDAQFILAAPLSYINPVTRELVRTLKYDGLKTAAEPLSFVLAEYLLLSFKNCPDFIEDSQLCRNKLKIESFILIPIPLHRTKERKRGFNQALIIAQKLKEYLNVDNPILTDILIKTKATPSQTEKENYKAREENIWGSFKIQKPELIHGKNIFLVDDVFTSGATMREAARILKIAGAKKIIALVAARA